MKPIRVGLVADPASPTKMARTMTDLRPPDGDDRDGWDIEAAPRVHVWRNREVCELRGGARLEEVVVQDMRTDERRPLTSTALFVLIGSEPHTGWLSGAVGLDDRGFVLTGAADTMTFVTTSPGIFAIGDVRSGSVKRVASAVGEGAIAVRRVYEHLVRAGRR